MCYIDPVCLCGVFRLASWSVCAQKRGGVVPLGACVLCVNVERPSNWLAASACMSMKAEDVSSWRSVSQLFTSRLSKGHCMFEIYFSLYNFVYASISFPSYIHLCLLFFWLLTSVAAGYHIWLLTVCLIDELYASSVYTAACCLEMYVAADFHRRSLSISVLFSFPLVSVLGWPDLVFLFSLRSPAPEKDGVRRESMKNFWALLCSETSLTALPHTEPCTERLLKVFFPFSLHF